MRGIVGASALALVVGLALRAIAASHQDSPSIKATPAAEITDVYAWMTADKSKVNLVMNVYPNAPSGTTFSSQVLYVFHVNSSASYLATTKTETKIICSFDAGQTVTCWVGNNEVVTGNASVAAGITSPSGKTRVFAGLRDDPSFFNQTGFETMAAIVQANPLPADATGCPTLNAAIAGALAAPLSHDGTGGPASNDFAGQNVLSIVIQVDPSLVSPGGKILGVWASTNMRG